MLAIILAHKVLCNTLKGGTKRPWELIGPVSPLLLVPHVKISCSNLNSTLEPRDDCVPEDELTSLLQYSTGCGEQGAGDIAQGAGLRE